jgi:hypothetical protein
VIKRGARRSDAAGGVVDKNDLGRKDGWHRSSMTENKKES